MSSVTKTNQGRYIILTSDATTTSTVIDQLCESLNGNKLPARNVIYFEPTTNKVAVAEVG